MVSGRVGGHDMWEDDEVDEVGEDARSAVGTEGSVGEIAEVIGASFICPTGFRRTAGSMCVAGGESCRRADAKKNALPESAGKVPRPIWP